MFGFLNGIRLYKYKKEWRIRNNHNHTYPYKEMPFEKIEIGKQTYGCIHAEFYNKNEEGLIIGNFCSIAPESVFICGGNHEISTLLTYPLGYYFDGEFVSSSKGKIIIKDDCWLGYGVTVLSGVTIGQGAVVAARSVVTRDVPPYAVVAGNPAKVIKYRFAEAVIEELLKCDFSIIDKNMYDKYKDYFHTEIVNREQCVEMLNKVGMYKRN